MEGELSLRDRLLKRMPIRDELALTLASDGLYAPVKRRAAFVSVDEPAVVVLRSGFVYLPPQQGAIVRWVSMRQDAGGASPWKFGLMTQAALAATGSAETATVPVIVPVWPDAPLLGVVRGYNFLFPIGSLTGDLTPEAAPFPCDLVVMPGNVFVVTPTNANINGEGAIYVEEFVNGDEQL